MKKKITKIWGVGLTLVLMATLLIGGAPASALTLSWGSETLISTANNVLGPGGVDIMDIAVANDATTIYVAAKATGDNNLVYKSTDAGVSWTNLSAATGLAIVQTDLIAVAPDNSLMAVVVDATTAPPTAFATTNGGTSWSTLGTIQSSVAAGAVAAAFVYDVDISPESAGIHYVAVAGREAGAAGFPGIYYFNMGSAAPVWKNAVLVGDFTGGAMGVAAVDSFRALAFSPNFASDQVLACVSEDTAGGGSARFHLASFASKSWDVTAGFTSYPVTLETAVGALAVADARIALTPDYLGSDDTMRIAFVGASVTDASLVTPEVGGIYRLSDVTLKQIKDSSIGMGSVDFDGTNLVAGATASNVVYRSADPLASTPTVSAASSLKRPGGETMAVAAWAGADVVCGTTGDESAFAVSKDNGKTFNDLSLIDTHLNVLEDVHVSDDGSKVYLLSNDIGLSGTVVTAAFVLTNAGIGTTITFDDGSVAAGTTTLAGVAIAATTDLSGTTHVIAAADQLGLGTTFNASIAGGVVGPAVLSLTNIAGSTISFSTDAATPTIPTTAGVTTLGGAVVAATTVLNGQTYTVGATDSIGIGTTVEIASDISLWRKASSWERVFSKLNDSGYITRGAPEDADVVFLAKSGATTLYFTSDAGENKWTIRASRYNLQDLAVESTDIAYIGVTGGATVSKSTNGGFTWATSVNTEIAGGNIHTIKSVGEDQVIVGSTTGYVSYSADGNTSWDKISKQLESGALLIQVTASGLDTDEYIYAASSLSTATSGTTVKRWQIGTSTAWKSLSAPTYTAAVGAVPAITYAAYGIILEDGVLYVLVRDTTTTTLSTLLVTLSPTASVPASGYWSTTTIPTAVFDRGPSTLTVSEGSKKLWAIDTAAGALYSYTDTLATVGPTLTGPADGYQNPMNPVTGRSVDIAFTWEKPSDNVTDYQVRIYADPECLTEIQSHIKTTTVTTPVVVMGPFQATTQLVEFTPGSTYYWKVRVSQTGPTYSQYSEVRSFTIEPGAALVPDISSPANGKEGVSLKPSFSWTPVAGATEYQFKLADNVALASPMVDVKVKATGYAITTELENGKTYYWSVKAISPVEGGWSSLANFTVKEVAVAPPPPIVVKEVPPPVINIPPAPAPPPVQEIVIPPAPAPPAPITPAYIWAIVIIGAVLVIAVIVLIVRTRRPV